MSRRQRRIENASTAELFDSMRAEYTAAKTSRYRRLPGGVASMGSGGDYHYRNEADYLRMMELARHFFRNNCVVAQGVRRLIDSVLQDGFTLDVQTGHDKADEHLAVRWKEWAEDERQCELSGRLDFHQIERLILQQVIVDGDILVLPLQSGELQLVEAHRLRTPTNAKRKRADNQALVHGVLIDEYRRPREYWITKDDIDPTRAIRKVSEMRRYAARDAEGNRAVLHIFRPDRVSQTRGVTAFAPSVEQLSMGDDLFFAKLVQAQHASVFTLIHEFREEFMGSGAVQRGERETETLGDGSTRVIEGVAPGMEVFAQPGETIKGWTPNIPQPGFFEHAKLILTFIAINLGLPLHVFLLDPERTNFSGWRGAIDQARLGFRQLQRWLISSFHRPVYQWKVRQWLAEDAVLQRIGQENPKLNLLGHRWQPRAWKYIEPLKDSGDHLLQWRNAMTPGRRIAAERGLGDYADLVREITEDNARLIRSAKQTADQLNKEFPDLNVSWREVACLPTPDGVKLVLKPGAGAEAAEEES